MAAECSFCAETKKISISGRGGKPGELHGEVNKV